MAIPDYQTLMLPLLKFISDGKERTLRETIDALALEFQLTEDELSEVLPSGSQTVFSNRVSWAKTYLLKAGLLSSPRRSVYVITDEGKTLLAENPKTVNAATLRRFSSYMEFIQTSKKKEPRDKNSVISEMADHATPEEALEYAFQELKNGFEQELLEKIKSVSPAFFEKMVVELLVKMGYGGSLKDAGMATRLSKDEGIDGIIKEDKLGLDNIYIQAKRWNGGIGRPEIQKFVGALAGKGARKGVFITTGYFSGEAVEYASRIDTRVVLIDGKTLAELMAEYNLGVSTSRVFQLKKIDGDYFEP